MRCIRRMSRHILSLKGAFSPLFLPFLSWKGSQQGEYEQYRVQKAIEPDVLKRRVIPMRLLRCLTYLRTMQSEPWSWTSCFDDSESQLAVSAPISGGTQISTKCGNFYCGLKIAKYCMSYKRPNNAHSSLLKYRFRRSDNQS